MLTPEARHKHKMCFLFVISTEEDKNKHGDPKKSKKSLVVDDGVVVGIFQLFLRERGDPGEGFPAHENRADTGMVIHHKFIKKGYGKEAMIAVLDYTLLGKLDLRMEYVIRVLD